MDCEPGGTSTRSSDILDSAISLDNYHITHHNDSYYYPYTLADRAVLDRCVKPTTHYLARGGSAVGGSRE
ncbi:hypothetical protein TVAGG3_0102490 [Trichomonas vaginalis G3]|uniref:hypothetical protein n=1 Tax=Trichomonas vaginalis (strain ATCC PRA-98 / G3) TaxID=412133 RepID=UPI0021E593AD|nr:hypothetical protein TVAGG3_0102490 [Trichomonas vaginalis G3]KAI5544454.1 hypothetical protein TVAGG3_0102490 [Trichomonas vaginalis G3]